MLDTFNCQEDEFQSEIEIIEDTDPIDFKDIMSFFLKKVTSIKFSTFITAIQVMRPITEGSDDQ